MRALLGTRAILAAGQQKIVRSEDVVRPAGGYALKRKPGKSAGPFLARRCAAGHGGDQRARYAVIAAWPVSIALRSGRWGGGATAIAHCLKRRPALYLTQ